MISIQEFTFNPFQENTYVLFDETKECIIVDPGCYEKSEKLALSSFIEKNQLKPVKLVNTHCHIDHVFGNKYVSERYHIDLYMHKQEIPVLASFLQVAHVYNIPMVEESPEAKHFLEEGDLLLFGNSSLQIAFTPGHSPGSISFYNVEQKIIIAGDVLFYGSVGRADLPGGDFNTLIRSIKSKLFTLGDDFTVYPGHGPHTTIGNEKRTNPFLKD